MECIFQLGLYTGQFTIFLQYQVWFHLAMQTLIFILRHAMKSEWLFEDAKLHSIPVTQIVFCFCV